MQALTHRGDQANDLVNMVYSSVDPVLFNDAAQRLCIGTANQSPEAMFDRRKNQIVRLTKGLVVMRGRGRSAQFERGMKMSHREAMARIKRV